MLEHLRRNAAQAGLQNIETLECAADELDKTQPPAEAIACRCKTACHDHRNSLGNSGVAKSGRVSMPTAARPPTADDSIDHVLPARGGQRETRQQRVNRRGFGRRARGVA
jgi:hypothetical protein